MKYSLILLLSLSITFPVLSQTIIVSNTNSGEPIEWATVQSVDPQVFATTNIKGQADISDFRGSNIIEIRSLGFFTKTISYDSLQKLNFKISLTPTNLNLDEVVISATRWKQVSGDIPLEIKSITPAMFNLIQPQTAADLLQMNGDVFVQKSQQGGGSPMIRGFATNRLLYVVDGVRMNTAIFRGGNIQNVISLDPFGLEKTEILFGAGSVIYGSDAIGGVMHFQTLIPEFSIDKKPLIFANSNARFSSANMENTGHFDFNVGFNKWAFTTSFSHFEYDHLMQGSNGISDYVKDYYVINTDTGDFVVRQRDRLLQVPTGYSQNNFMQKVRYKPTDNWDLTYGYHNSALSSYGRYDRHNRVKNGLPRYGEWDYGPQLWEMHHLKIAFDKSNLMFDEVSFSTAYQLFEESRISRVFNDSSRLTNIENVTATSVNLDFVKVFRNHTLKYGGEWISNDVSSTGNEENIHNEEINSAPSRYPQSYWQSLGVFANEQINVSKQLSLHMGLRYNTFKLNAKFNHTLYPLPFQKASLQNEAITGNMGVVYRPEVSAILSCNFSTAFRAPNVDDMGKIFESGDGFIVIPNPNLSAEYAYTFDARLVKVFFNTIKVNLSGYYTYLDRALVRRDDILDGADSVIYEGIMSKVQSIQNAAFAKAFGVKTEIDASISSSFEASMILNLQKGNEEMDNGETSPLRHAPPAFGKAALTYNFKKMSLMAYALFQAERSFNQLALDERTKTEIYALDENGLPYAPKWLTINLKSKYRIADWMSVAYGIENILNMRYRPYSSGISAPGRNFTAALNMKF